MRAYLSSILRHSSDFSPVRTLILSSISDYSDKVSSCSLNIQPLIGSLAFNRVISHCLPLQKGFSSRHGCMIRRFIILIFIMRAAYTGNHQKISECAIKQQSLIMICSGDQFANYGNVFNQTIYIISCGKKRFRLHGNQI